MGYFSDISLRFGNLIFYGFPIVEIAGESASQFEVLSHFPEILLVSVALFAWACSPIGIYYGSARSWHRYIIGLMLLSVVSGITLLVTAIYFYNTEQGTLYVWYDSLISDYFVMFFKIVLLVIGAAILLFIILSFNGNNSQYWVFILVFTALPGFTLLVSVNDFLSLFVVVEFVSLVAYILPVLGNENKKSGTLASAKYYVLGAIASALLLTGVIVLSTENASFNFDEIQLNWTLGLFSSLQFCGLIIILCAFSIKIAVFPAYAWVFDVYSGASYSILLVFGILSKLGIVGLFIRLYLMLWPWLYQHYSVPLCYLSIATIIGGMLGAFYSFVKNKVKAFIGYTGINQIGYIFIGLCLVDSFDVVNASIYYLVLYSIANLVFIGSLAYLSSKGYEVTRFDQISLAYFKNRDIGHKYFIVLIGLSVWSIAGLPPFGNFFAKISLWSSMLYLLGDCFYLNDTNQYLLFNPQFFIDLYSVQPSIHNVVIGLIITSLSTSIISLYYYLGIVGFIISPRSIEVEGGSPNLENSSWYGTVWLFVVIIFILVLCVWGFAVGDPLLVPEFFVRVI